MRTLWPVCLAVLCVGVALGLGRRLPHCSADPDVLPGTAVDKLIAQLGSDSDAVREAATKQLKQREDAIPALRRALKSSNGEVARGAATILAFFAAQEERAVAKLVALGKNGQMDQAVEKLVRRQTLGDEDGCWQVLAELASRLMDLEKEEFGTVSLKPGVPNREVPARDFRRYWQVTHPRLVSGSRLSRHDLLPPILVVRAEELSTDMPKILSLLAASGHAKTIYLESCALLAGDSSEMVDIDSSLIVCDGDLLVKGYIKESLVIARGDITCCDLVENSRLICGGAVHLRDYGKLLETTKVKAQEAKPLGFITFFDPVQVGIKVAKADGGLRVQEAVKDKPFARAGVRAEDLVLALDGAAVTDPEVFRRLLRARVAVEGELAVKLRRGEQTLELRVQCKD
jgi:hypothetical protein